MTSPPAHRDLVRGDLTATDANELWLADTTQHHTLECDLHLGAVNDLFSTRIVGNAIDSRIKARITVASFDNAVARCTDVAY